MFETPLFSVSMDEHWKPVPSAHATAAAAPELGTPAVETAAFEIAQSARINVQVTRETLIEFDLTITRSAPTQAFGVYQGTLELFTIPATSGPAPAGPAASGLGHPEIGQSASGAELDRKCRLYFAAAIGINPIDFRPEPAQGVQAQPVLIRFESFRVLSN